MDLREKLETAVNGLGFELVDLEMSNHGKLLRLFIDKPAGINVGDCALVSSHLTRLFAVENVDYERLEVSSPGLDRVLRNTRISSDLPERRRKSKCGCPYPDREVLWVCCAVSTPGSCNWKWTAGCCRWIWPILKRPA